MSRSEIPWHPKARVTEGVPRETSHLESVFSPPSFFSTQRTFSILENCLNFVKPVELKETFEEFSVHIQSHLH